MVVTILRWIGAGLGSFLAIGALLAFVLFIAFESEIWLDRARRLRTWLWLLSLFWFNCEVWGRVAFTLVHWH